MKNWIKSNKWKLVVGLFVIAILFVCVALILDWSAKHKLQNPLQININTRKVAVEKKVEVISPIPDTPEQPDWYKDLTDIEKKIVDTFGVENAQVALAVAEAESGMSCEATNANTNGTVDLGPFQVNSLHLKRYSLSEIADCERNIEIAYEIWDRADGTEGDGKGSFRPWSAFNNTSFVRFID